MANSPLKTASESSEHNEARELQLWDRFIFYFTVTITGGSIMMIELMGTRIIGPFFGVSLVVWSSLLATALFALAVGYFVGGRVADKQPWFRPSHIVLLAAVWVAIIPWISEPVQLAVDPLGLRMGALASAFLLFTFPLFMLGMVGPYVIKLATQRLEVVGSTVGNVYAVSTLGSVAGTLILGFYLLPAIGVEAVIWLISGVLTALSLLLSVYEHKALPSAKTVPVWKTAACLVAAVVVLAIAMTKSNKEYVAYDVIMDDESEYGWIRVVDQKEGDIRFLLADSSTIGAESISTGRPMLSYQEIVSLLPAFNRDANDMLLIGLGSGHMVTTFGEQGITTDSIEIDPSVVKAAKKYFNFQPTGKVIVGDARYQIKDLDKKYDFIIHDCFTGGSEPIHLLSREMISELKAMLKPGGILALNFVGFNRDKDDRPVESVAMTLDTEFEYRKNFVSVPDAEWNDFIFFVSDEPLAISNNSPADMAATERLSKHEVSVAGTNGMVITDNYNPLESMQLAKAEYYRDVLIDRLGKDILFR